MNRSPLKFFVLVFAFSIPILADTAARLAYIGLRGCSAHSGFDPCLQRRGRRWGKEAIEQSLRPEENQERDLVWAHHLTDACCIFADLWGHEPDGATTP